MQLSRIFLFNAIFCGAAIAAPSSFLDSDVPALSIEFASTTLDEDFATLRTEFRNMFGAKYGVHRIIWGSETFATGITDTTKKTTLRLPPTRRVADLLYVEEWMKARFEARGGPPEIAHIQQVKIPADTPGIIDRAGTIEQAKTTSDYTQIALTLSPKPVGADMKALKNAVKNYVGDDAYFQINWQRVVHDEVEDKSTVRLTRAQGGLDKVGDLAEARTGKPHCKGWEPI